jgi:hypothetical protein
MQSTQNLIKRTCSIQILATAFPSKITVPPLSRSTARRDKGTDWLATYASASLRDATEVDWLTGSLLA